MKDINQIIEQRNASESQQPSWTSKTSTGEQPNGAREDPISAQTKTLVNMIFARFMTIYGHKFKSAFSNEDEVRIAKREWALSLQGCSEGQLVMAVNRCKETLEWMPTVAEFLSILRNARDQFGLPADTSAYVEACQYSDDPLAHKWSHPAVYFAGRETDWFRLRTEDKDQVYGDFLNNYQALCQRVIAGENFNIPAPKALPDHSSATLAEYMESWGKTQQVTPEQAATLLFYLQKPKGPVRDRFRAQAQLLATQWQLNVTLPDEVGAI